MRYLILQNVLHDTVKGRRFPFNGQRAGIGYQTKNEHRRVYTEVDAAHLVAWLTEREDGYANLERFIRGNS